MKVNKAGADWIVLRAEIMSQIEDCSSALEHDLPESETYKKRGELIALRGLMKFVEDDEPPLVEDANYVG